MYDKYLQKKLSDTRIYSVGEHLRPRDVETKL